tara:strand:+ start:381 stop:653 length:273 start_codon:yes stop_codon:yes gene_type:complete
VSISKKEISLILWIILMSMNIDYSSYLEGKLNLYIYFLSVISLYELGTIIKNNTHQIIIKKEEIEVIIILLNIIQLNAKNEIPKVIIDQG